MVLFYRILVARSDLKSCFIAVALVAFTGCSGSGDVYDLKAPNKEGASLFLEVASRFEKCEMGDLYIDEFSRSTSNDYLLANESRQCGVTEDVVTYCVDEQFYGLSVSRISVPRTTWPVFALHFSESLNVARRKLQSEFGHSFHLSESSRAGVRPELSRDPSDHSGSVLVCTKPE